MTLHERRQNWWPTHEQLDNARWHERATRRYAIKAGAGAGVLAAAGGTRLRSGVLAQESSPAAGEATSTGVCVLTPRLTDGPYYLDDMLVREDITEGKAGIPMALRVTVVDASTCAPIENAAVDIWHCDGNGYYSGFTGADPDPQDPEPYQDDGSNPDTFLRGVLLSDASGIVEFQTIYPGWYVGRAVHIHMKVHVGGATDDGTYDGGSTAHTGQLAFSDEFTERVSQVEPYAGHVSNWTRVDQDGIFAGLDDDDPAYFVVLAQVDESDLSLGVTAEITVGIDSGNQGE
ncbi:MAG TPA: intradiol ring-cleavage dioxygenase [Thermomicrobiales bacterium]|nr:intradiol ring-cleavage dioxygenase [Thermomicrobiales bacterium]